MKPYHSAALAIILFSGMLFRYSIKAEECKAIPDWFTATKPPDTSEPPHDSECAFYQRSWELFLWLTAEDSATKQPRFVGFTTPSELFTEPGSQFPKLTTFAKTLRLNEGSKKGAIKRLGMALRLEKSPTGNPTDIDSGVIQATSKGALVDQNGRAVYFAQHVDPVFEKFIKDSDFQNASHLADAKPEMAFPPGSIELKSSWRVKQPNESGKGFIQVSARVPKLLAQANGDIEVSPTETRDEDMLLVGLHVVFVTQGHPEFIWSTFEHVENAPDLGEGWAKTSDSPEPVNSTKDYTFYKHGTPAKGCNKAGKLIGLPGPDEVKLTLDGDPSTQKLAPVSQTFREFRHGGEPKPNEEIIPLNNSVHSMLPQDSPIASYILIGALWMNEPTLPTFRPGKEFGEITSDSADQTRFGGETKLSNATMETYTQNAQNCFSCHNTTSFNVGNNKPFPATLLGTSHILRDAYKRNPKTNN